MRVQALLQRDDPTPPSQEPFLAKLLAYIPAEIIAAYQALSKLLAPDPTEPTKPARLYAVQWTVLVVVTVLTPAWMAFSTWAKPHSREWLLRIIASPLSFLVWSFVLAGPWLVWFAKKYPGYVQDYGTIAAVILIVVTLVLPLLEWIVSIRSGSSQT